MFAMQGTSLPLLNLSEAWLVCVCVCVCMCVCVSVCVCVCVCGSVRGLLDCLACVTLRRRKQDTVRDGETWCVWVSSRSLKPRMPLSCPLSSLSLSSPFSFPLLISPPLPSSLLSSLLSSSLLSSPFSFPLLISCLLSSSLFFHIFFLAPSNLSPPLPSPL